MGSQESDPVATVYHAVIQCHGVRSDGRGKGVQLLWSLRGIFQTHTEALAFIRPIGKIVNGVPSHAIFSYACGSDMTALAPFGHMMYYDGAEPFGPWQIQERLREGFEQTDL